MKCESKPDNERVWLRFEAGEELCTELERFIEKEQIGSAVITGLGFAKEIEMQVYDVSRQEAVKKQFCESLEIVSLIGLAADGKLHLHCTFADPEMK